MSAEILGCGEVQRNANLIDLEKSRKMLKKACTLAFGGVDTAEIWTSDRSIEEPPPLSTFEPFLHKPGKDTASQLRADVCDRLHDILLHTRDEEREGDRRIEVSTRHRAESVY